MSKKLRYKSAFDIIGPIMVGPSSSHTAGAVRIGQVAQELFQQKVSKLIVTFYGSFAETYKGHGTAVAIVAGVLGFDPADERIPGAITIAESRGIAIEFLISKQPTAHANTVNLQLIGVKDQLDLTGVSIGGGNIQIIEINQYAVDLADSQNAVVLRTDSADTIDKIKNTLTDSQIITLPQSAEEKLFIVETVHDLTQRVLAKIREIPGIIAVVPTSS